MCGISGIINFGKNNINHKIFKMNQIMNHRGPDDNGYNFFNLEDEKVSLKGNPQNFQSAISFNRLSIQDLTINGHQPFTSFDESVSIMLNGEIYNFNELKKNLTNLGYKFKSNSDTEVVLNFYLEYGFEKLINSLRGMFVIFIIDLKTKKIIIARDKLGIKPIYFYNDNNHFIFASEAKAILSTGILSAETNLESFIEFNVFGNLSSKETLFKKINILEPGQFLSIYNNKLIINNYWEYKKNKNIDYSKNELLENTKNILTNSISDHLISDAPLATQLSGGVDSSLITAIAVKDLNKKLDSVSITIDNSDLSESKYIDEVKKSLSINNSKFNFSDKTFIKNIEKAVWHYDYPFSIANSLGILELSKNSKKNYSVLLSGEGADELFFGYNKYFRIKLFSDFIKNFQSLGKYHFLLKMILLNKSNFNFIKLFCNNNIFPIENTNYVINKRLNKFFKNESNFIENYQKYELRTHLHELLIRQDKMSMAHSIENRVPFISDQMIELSENFSADNNIIYSFHSKKRSVNSKILLKEISRSYFSDEFIYRNKSGFSLPLISYFKNKDFEDFYQIKILPTLKNNPYFDVKKITAFKSNIDYMDNNDIKNFFSLITFACWQSQFNVSQ